MRYLLLCLTFLFAAGTPLSASESEGVDVKEIVLGHLADAYEWHITTIGGKHISIPLPVIVRSEATGEWYMFCSSRIEEAMEEGKDYMGFYFNEEKNGKIYERLSDGKHSIVVAGGFVEVQKNKVSLCVELHPHD